MDVTLSVMVRPGTEVGVSVYYRVSVGDDNVGRGIAEIQKRKAYSEIFFQRSIRLLRDACRTESNIRSSRPEVFCEKGVLRNFAKVAG